MQVSVLGPQSVDGVRGGSLMHGSCTISPRLTRGCQVSGDGREWRQALSCYAEHFHANSILFKTFASNIRKLNRAQNTLAWIVLRNLWSTPVASLLIRLYWLPVISRIKYKQATITYKSQLVAQPTYLHLLLQQYQRTRSLWSGSQNLLVLPILSPEFGRHAFNYCAPSV